MRERDLVWNKLEKARRKFNRTSILEQFQKDPQRHDVFSFRLNNLFVDLSKNLIDQQVLKDLQELATIQEVDKIREGLFSGAILNNTEKRPALHVALRTPKSSVITVEGINIVPAVILVWITNYWTTKQIADLAFCHSDFNSVNIFDLQ